MRFAIVGGTGKMGLWFARALAREGQQVLLIGRSRAKLEGVRQQLDVETATDIARVADCDVIIVSVPPDAFEDVVARLAPHTHQGQVVADVTSLKTQPVDAMHRHITSATVLGVHPVFGPGAKSLARLNFVLTPTSDREAAVAAKVKAILEERGARVWLMPPRQHDEMMTVILGLAHFIAIVSAEALLGQPEFRQMREIGGTTYKLLHTLVESVLSEDPELYASLQMSFPGIADVEAAFLRAAGEWASLVRDGDRGRFVTRMAALKDKLEETDPHFQQAYEDMYRITGDL